MTLYLCFKDGRALIYSREEGFSRNGRVIDDYQTIVLRDYFLFTAFTWPLVQDWIDCTCCCARELKIHKRKLQVNKRKVARLVDLISA